MPAQLFSLPVIASAGALMGVVLLSLASRRWRTTSVPWGAVPALALALHADPRLTAVAAVMLVAVEMPGRSRLAVEILAAPLAAFAGAAASALVPDPATLLPAMYLLALVTARLGRRLARNLGIQEVPLAADAASALLLLAGSVLASLGYTQRAPVAGVLGLAIPLALPALLAGATSHSPMGLVCRRLFSILPRLNDTVSTQGAQTLDDLAHSLHELFHPILEHSASVVAINPPFAGEGSSLGAYPVAGEDRLRIRERVRRLFQSRKADELHGVTVTSKGEGPLLHPAYPFQMLIPAREGEHLVGLVAFLCDHSLAEGDQEVIPEIALTAEGYLLHLVRDRTLFEEAQSLQRRLADQARRLHHLLTTSQAIYTSPDLRSVTNNLVRAARVGFGLAWCAVLMDPQGRGTYRMTARSGLPEEGLPSGRQAEIPLDLLRKLLSDGKAISRCSVIPAREWPLEGGAAGHEHLVLVPVGQEDPPAAYLVLAPHPMKPMLELDEVRALETVVDQAASVIFSALHFEELRRQTLVDALTGVANRRSLDTVLARLLQQAGDEPLSVAMVDADDFKAVNDRFGHQVGDVVLKEIASLVSRRLRARDFVARYGGEEFAAVMPGLSSEQAALVLERVRRAVAEFPFASGELSQPINLTVSIGVATFPDDGSTPAVLIARADEALYEAKRLGKNRVMCAGEVGLWTAYGSGDPFV